MLIYDSDGDASLCCQPADDSDTEPPEKVAGKKDPGKRRCDICGESAFGEAALCLACYEIHAASLATRCVAVNTLSGKPVLSHMPTIRGDMLVRDVKMIYMLGVGKTNPKDVEIVPAVPAGFASDAPMSDQQPVGLHGEEVQCIAVNTAAAEDLDGDGKGAR